MSDIYDSAFRTILNDCHRFIIPVINEAFGENYTGNETIEFYPNEHFINQQEQKNRERITDTNFIIQGKHPKKYHWECQSTPDNRMLIRLFEYDAQIALDQGEVLNEMLIVDFPNSAVLYLRCNRKTPERYRYRIQTPGGSVEYNVPVIKCQAYSLKSFVKICFYFFHFIYFHMRGSFPNMRAVKKS